MKASDNSGSSAKKEKIRFTNNGLFYERYYYYDTDEEEPKYFDFGKKNDEHVAIPFFRDQHNLLTGAVLPKETDAHLLGDDISTINLRTVYPGLVTGIGNTHETGSKSEAKLGFSFDYSSGLPFIPGSSVKGILRSAFPQWNKHRQTDAAIKEVKTSNIYALLHSKDFGDCSCTEAMKKEVTEMEEAIFESRVNGQFLSVYDRDIFYDAVITGASKFEPAKDKIIGMDFITPHGDDLLLNPNVLPFIKVLPGVQFQFHFRLHPHIITVEQKRSLFRAILLQQGAGAKTNVGYGQFE
jgi:CRISPR-associated protein Cmr6